MPYRNALEARLRSVAVETKAVNGRAGLCVTKHARSRIPGLRQRRYGTQFDKAKAEIQHFADHLALLVETGGKADRIRKSEAADRRTQDRIIDILRLWPPTFFKQAD